MKFSPLLWPYLGDSGKIKNNMKNPEILVANFLPYRGESFDQF